MKFWQEKYCADTAVFLKNKCVNPEKKGWKVCTAPVKSIAKILDLLFPAFIKECCVAAGRRDGQAVWYKRCIKPRYAGWHHEVVLYGLMPVTGGRRLNCYGEFVSLTNEQIKKYSEQFGKISQFTGQEPELSSRMTIIAFWYGKILKHYKSQAEKRCPPCKRPCGAVCPDLEKVDKMTGWRQFCPVWGEFGQVKQNVSKQGRMTSSRIRDMAEKEGRIIRVENGAG